uniref:ABC transmembrane type-2 domain-containing protein n=1 Tax=Apoglossum ruscifolium TaxID=167976 RepID=A0A4D6WLK0_9FLOR|nr:hypothetical protein [Apoglossum ruscifolium]
MYYKSFKKQYNTIKPNCIIQIYKKKTNNLQEIQALITRLYIQINRKPSNIIANIIQPLLWLILFGALFQNAPINLFGQYHIKYTQFLSYGIIIFCAFTSSINAGLPIIFDREFGFFNRLIISPLIYKNSLFLSLIIYTLTISICEIIAILIFSTYFSQNISDIHNLLTIIIITTMIIINISNISLCISLILPGHIEFLALTLIINLPTLFSSTALAPLSFMPYWLQIITCLNPLTYAIEIIRYICINNSIEWNIKLIETLWFSINLRNSILILIIINLISFIAVKKILQSRYN